VITGQPRPDVFPNDDSLLLDIPEETEIIRSIPTMLSPSEWCRSKSALLGLEVIGGQIGRVIDGVARRAQGWFPPWSWQAAAFRDGMEAASKWGCDVVLSTSYPVISHYVGATLSSSLSCPWVADIRDPLIGDRAWFFRTSLEKKELRRGEHFIANRADAIINVHSNITQDMATRHKNIQRSKFYTVLNGFDPSDLDNAKCKSRKNGEPFVLTYMGTIYPECDISPLLMAVQRLQDDNIHKEVELRLDFYGSHNSRLNTLLESGKYPASSYLGYLSHERVKDVLTASDALVLLVSPLPMGRHIVTGKIFEYIGIQKPILLIGPSESPAAEIVQSLEAGVVIPLGDPHKVRDGIIKLLDTQRNGYEKSFYKNTKELNRYTRRSQASEVAKILSSLV